MMLFIALLVCLAVNIIDAEDCFIGDDPIALTTETFTGIVNAIVIPNAEHKFLTNATVKEFQAYIELANVGVYLGIYRPTQSGFLLIGRKFFETNTTGYHSIPLIPSEYINVQPGDTLGMQVYEGYAIDMDIFQPCAPGNGFYNLVGMSQIAEIGNHIQTIQETHCLRMSLKAIADCSGGGLEPHFMIMSGNNHMCFNLHGENDDIYDLVSDPISDVYVRGKTFEIESEDLLNPLSYFSAIGVSTKNNQVVFTVKGLTENGKFYSFNNLSKLEFEEITITMKAPNKYLVSVRDKMELMVVISHNAVAEFLGIYTLSKRGLSEQTGGILGQFFNTEFDVNTVNGKLVLDFNDHHKSVNVFKISQLATFSKEPIDCYYYSWLTDQTLLGKKSLYKKNSITN